MHRHCEYDCEYDAIVIGGGPAGSAAALALARRGWRVVLLERSRPDRDKTCGGCLHARAFPFLERLGVLDAVLATVPRRMKRVRIWAPRGGRGHACLGVALDAPGVFVERHHFDAMLVDRAAAAGVQVLYGAAARLGASAGRHGRTVMVSERGCTRRFVAPLVVGADGVRSAVGMAAGIIGEGEPGRNYGFSFDGAAGTGAMLEPETIHMFVSEGGYLGVVRTGDTLHVGCLVRRATRARGPGPFVRAVASRFPALRSTSLIEATPQQDPHFVAAGAMPWRPRDVAGAQVALVGDAAGYVEPFTGEGLTWALQSAWLLGEAVGRPGRWTPETAAAYRRAWRDRIGRSHRRCARLALALDRPWLFDVIHRVGSRQPRMARRFVHRVTAA